MSENAPLGKNCTGIQASPLESKQLIYFVNEVPPDIEGDGQSLASARKFYIKNAEKIGSVPPPISIKGAMSALMKKITGKNLEVLIDKLSERLAFERTGVRLYDALIAKAEVAPDHFNDFLATLQTFRGQELEHFQILVSAIESLGADPTAQTPCADTVGVSSLGLIQVITDPRTNLAQSLNALLVAELADNAGWELLIKLANQLNLNHIAETFQRPLEQEEAHLYTIKRHLQTLILQEAS